MADETLDNPAASKFESGKAHAIHAAEDLRAAAEAKAQEFRGRAEQVYGDYRTRARTVHEEGEHYVRENPTKAVLAALGIGFVLGLIFRR